MKTVILTILVFGVIIMLHESGHFLFAKLFHVKVEEFSFGMGPKLWSRIKRGTQYTIRAFPIGGYVAMEGEDDAGSGAVVREKIVSAAEGGPLYEKPAWQRFIIMAAGAVMNVILGFIILIVVTAMSGLIGTTTVAVFDEDSVSANYLQAGDEIIKVNGYNTRFYGDATFQMLRDQDGTIDFTLIRDGEVMEVTVPFRTEELSDGITGMHMDFKFLGEPVNFSTTITYAWHWTFSLVLADMACRQSAVQWALRRLSHRHLRRGFVLSCCLWPISPSMLVYLICCLCRHWMEDASCSFLLK